MRRRETTCRLCGTPHDLTRHHVIPQGVSTKELARAGKQPPPGLLVESRQIRDRRNIVMLCRRHHDAIDEYRILRGLLRSLLTEQEAEYVENTAGPEWFEAAYPTERNH